MVDEDEDRQIGQSLQEGGGYCSPKRCISGVLVNSHDLKLKARVYVRWQNKELGLHRSPQCPRTKLPFALNNQTLNTKSMPLRSANSKSSSPTGAS